MIVQIALEAALFFSSKNYTAIGVLPLKVVS